jgi:hypothetical protein
MVETSFQRIGTVNRLAVETDEDFMP